MKFPSIIELVTTDVTLLDISATLHKTIELMYEQNHRSVIIQDSQRFYIVTASDLLKLKLKGYNFEQKLSQIRLTEIPTIHADKNILESISFLEQSIEYISVVDRYNKFCGILTHTDIISNIDPETLMDNYKICDLININKPICKVKENVATLEVLTKMVESNLDNVIIEKDNKPQRELISLSYSKWATLMKEYSSELSQINELLNKKSKKYEQMASVDQLTGLYNRYKFTELFVSLYSTMVKRENDMSLIILDIDHFKHINDTYGHNVGDKVLVELAKILKNHFRNVDIVGRWGGEEFVILVPTADIDTAQKIAEKIRLNIEQSEILKDETITSSFGVTQIKSGDSLEFVIARADEALYDAKETGRNKVVVKL